MNSKGQIKSNNIITKPSKDMFPACYEGFDINKYFINKPVLHIESSRGCYYGKCEFCDFKSGAYLKQKKVEDLVKEMQEIKEKYNNNIFFFTDSAISPEYAKKLSKCIIENNLKIYYVAFVRLEHKFSKQLLEQMYKSGMRVCLWGLESGSDRILQLYQKGTNTKTNQRILKDAHSVGLTNYAYCIIGFPMEKVEDLNQTIEFLTKNEPYIDYVSPHQYTLLKGAPIAENPEKFGLTPNDFSYENYYKPYVSSDISMIEIKNAFSTIRECYEHKYKKLPDDQICQLLYLLKDNK